MALAVALPFSQVCPGRRDPGQGGVFPGSSPHDGEPHPSHRTGPGPVSLIPHLIPLPIGRRSRANEAQHPGDRVQEELAVGSPGHGGGLHRHPAVSEGTREAGVGSADLGL